MHDCSQSSSVEDFLQSLLVFANLDAHSTLSVVPFLSSTEILFRFVAQSQAIGEEVVLQLTIGTRTAELQARGAGFQLSSGCCRVELDSVFGVGGCCLQ